jgi:hypothetical protein
VCEKIITWKLRKSSARKSGAIHVSLRRSVVGGSKAEHHGEFGAATTQPSVTTASVSSESGGKTKSKTGSTLNT